MAQNLSYHDYLIMRGTQYKEKRDKQAVDQYEAKGGEFNFMPQTLAKKSANLKDAIRGSPDKWSELYKQAERKKAIDKHDKPIDDIEYEKNVNEFTFQPNKDLRRKRHQLSIVMD